ncbi:MAG TPA: peptidoglycan DD-metalloendopeptidase family protein [Candidatus Micrarchaeaceae archaeon]|nr:peptidoglycan DD-metalloendopeptidase family protein [Candidatus Micrarchaeaceae archaeon]
MTHAVVLAVAAAMCGYTAFDRNINPNLHAPAFTAAAAAGTLAGGQIAVGRDSVIIKPLSIPTSPLISRAPVVHIVEPGDTLESIGQQFNLPWRDIVWSNPGLRMPLTVGRAIELPPVPGAVVVVKKGDTPASLASRYGVDASTLLGFNKIRGPQLTPGSVLVIPVAPVPGPNLSTGAPADPVDPGQFLCPIAGASIIQPFGPTSFALEPPFDGYQHFHTGVDLLAGYGTPILAAAGGKVTAVGYAFDFGIRVEVTDSFGLVEIYAHMSQVAVALGQEVQQGEKIGYVGSTGLSIGAHLHFQLEVGGMPIAPGPLIGC